VTVYVVLAGEYSDYSLEGVFSSREKAEKFAERWDPGKPYSVVRIEEWVVDAND